MADTEFDVTMVIRVRTGTAKCALGFAESVMNNLSLSTDDGHLVSAWVDEVVRVGRNGR